MSSKSRYLGLSQKLRVQNDSYNGIKEDKVNLLTGYFKGKAGELLETQVNVNEYRRNSILVYDTKMYNLLACNNRIKQTPNPIIFNGYTFIHAVVNVDGKNGTKPFIPGFFIDKKILEGIEQSDIKTIEKSLGFLGLVGNHDTTMHTLGLALLKKYPEINQFLEDYIVYDFKGAAITEILSAQLHKCVVEEILTNNSGFKKMIEKSIENYCESIKNFDEKKRKYFNSVLKYVISGYIDFDGDIVTNFKNKYPILEFEHNKWSKVIQNKKVTINNGVEVDSEQMLKALRKDFLSTEKLPIETSKLIIPEVKYDEFLLKMKFEKKFNVKIKNRFLKKKSIMNFIKIVFEYEGKTIMDLFKYHNHDVNTVIEALVGEDNWEEKLKEINENYDKYKNIIEFQKLLFGI